MHQAIVRVICAIGQSGQMGLEGRLPWEGSRSPEYKADVARFFEITRGHVLAAGPTTIGSVPELARADRGLFVLRSSMDPEETLTRFSGRVVFIGGGPPVWDAYAPFVSHWDITRLSYDGPADRWFDPAWLKAGGSHS
ncbi:dihydrofolate reductase family protein [Mesorhizobium sp. A556]